jgi:predicted AlkP superfamily pyrophosphatase or phosphodiesterase
MNFRRIFFSRSFSRALIWLGAAILWPLAFSCAAADATAVPERPRLVVLLVIDGLPQRQLLAYRDQLAPDGFARFLDRGAWYATASYSHAYTVTASGHAALLTGAYPHRTGIIGNEWRDPASGAEVYNSGDTSATYIGHATRPLDGTSPRRLKAETLGDVLRRIDPRSKVISVSGKDRGAILTAGHSGTAYMYMASDGQFASTTYYMPRHPAWVDAFNARRPADRYFGAQWKPLLPEAAYARSLPDDQPWFGPRGGRLPMTFGGAGQPRGPDFYGALTGSPFVDQLDLDFARAAIEGEQLGRDDATDILAISLSGHDSVNHQWSAESRLSHDHLLWLDRMLQDFFHDLDASVGRDNYVAVLTADHGFMPSPDYLRAKGIDAGRISLRQVLARIDAGLEKKFGAQRLVIGTSGPSLLLNKSLIAQRGLDADAVAEEARRLLLAEPAIATAYTRRELLAGSRRDAPYFEAARKSFHPDVSGDVQFTPRSNWMFGSAVATHGSPHDYDALVPLCLYGPKWVKPGRVEQRVDVVDIAPTLARMLGVPAPAQSEGRLLPMP